MAKAKSTMVDSFFNKSLDGIIDVEQEVLKLSDAELHLELKKFDMKIGPVIGSTRKLYQKKLIKYLKSAEEKKTNSFEALNTSPSYPSLTNDQSVNNNSMTVDSSSLSDLELEIFNLSDSELHSELKYFDEKIGPVNDSTRKLYQKKLLHILKSTNSQEISDSLPNGPSPPKKSRVVTKSQNVEKTNSVANKIRHAVITSEKSSPVSLIERKRVLVEQKNVEESSEEDSIVEPDDDDDDIIVMEEHRPLDRKDHKPLYQTEPNQYDYSTSSYLSKYTTNYPVSFSSSLTRVNLQQPYSTNNTFNKDYKVDRLMEDKTKTYAGSSSTLHGGNNDYIYSSQYQNKTAIPPSVDKTYQSAIESDNSTTTQSYSYLKPSNSINAMGGGSSFQLNYKDYGNNYRDASKYCSDTYNKYKDGVDDDQILKPTPVENKFSTENYRWESIFNGDVNEVRNDKIDGGKSSLYPQLDNLYRGNKPESNYFKSTVGGESSTVRLRETRFGLQPPENKFLKDYQSSNLAINKNLTRPTLFYTNPPDAKFIAPVKKTNKPLQLLGVGLATALFVLCYLIHAFMEPSHKIDIA